jgi:hypothetical protein
MDIGCAVFRPVEITGATVGLELVARHVHYGHVLRVPSPAFRLRDDVVEIDVILEEFSAADLLLADTASVALLNPQTHTKG